MCGRITLKNAPPELGELFREVAIPPDINWPSRYNVAPSQRLVVVPNHADVLRHAHAPARTRGGGRRRIGSAWFPDTLGRPSQGRDRGTRS